MNLSSKLCRTTAGWTALTAALAGCAGNAGLRGDADEPRRHPDGVAIDPVSAPPAARDSADSSEGLLTLRTPLGVDRALAAVDELFRKIVVEDGEGIDVLFTRDALAITGSGQTPQAVLFWQGRFRKLDYTRLAGELLYRPDDLTVFRASDGLDPPPHPAIRPEALGSSDIVIRVPIVTPRIGADRLLGDEMIVWLRRDGDRYKIYRILEDFQLS